MKESATSVSTTTLSTVGAGFKPAPTKKWTDLPDGWVWKTMGEISDVVGGGTPRTNIPEYYENGNISWITPADLSGYNEKYISHGSRFITKGGLRNSSARLMPAGTVLFTSRAPIGYVAIAKNPISTNQGFKSFVLIDGILPDYIYWYLKGNKNLAESLASGTTFLELSGAKAKQIPVPLAPLDQQKLIVAEIEKQFSRLDEAVAALKRIQANLKRYKASVLKAAVEGKLTEQWRKEHPDIEPASELLKRILAERKKKWEETNPGKKYKEPASPDTSNLPELLKGWAWCCFQQLCQSSQNGLSKRSSNEGTPMHVLRLADISNGKIREDAPRDILLSDQEILNYKIENNDLLCIRVNGSPNLVGRLIVFRSSEKWAFCDHFIRFRVPINLISSDYVSYLFNTKTARRYVELNMVSSAGQNTVSQTTVGVIPLPLPNLREQSAIVEQIERCFSVADEIELAIDTNLKRSDRLRQSILKKAFSGKLV